jgi:hypothetical protein
VSKRIVLIVAAGVAVAGLAVQVAGATPKQAKGASSHAVVRSPHMLIGINDEQDALYGNPFLAFQNLVKLKTQVLRVNMYWGGNKWAVANSKPTDGTDPGDPAYNWALYDRLVQYASNDKIKVVFSIVGTPSWANGGKKSNVAPTQMSDLQDFAHAAAVRYSGYWTPPSWQYQPTLGIDGSQPLPVENLWTAWNEPNNPVFLTPQYKHAGGKWVVQSAVTYAKMCNAVYRGVHGVLISPQKGLIKNEKVACGVTDPKGNDNPNSSRPSVDPLTFLTSAKKAGMGPFDAYAHNPYASAGVETPSYVPRGRTARRIQMGNLATLMALLHKYYGNKHLWITEYGYQTNPPDKTIFATTWAKQAQYMKQAVAIARATPRVDMFIWYLLKDETKKTGWHSGLETASGQHKPSWNAFISLPKG